MDEKKLKIEKRAMNFSFAGSVAFAVIELVMYLTSGSGAVLMDFVFDFVDVILIGPFLVLIPLLYKPVTERHPFGFGQVESLFIIVKYVGLVVVCVMLLFQNVKAILGGGREVDARDVVIYEALAALFTFLMYMGLMYLKKKYESLIIESEVYSWKIYVFVSAGLALAFLVSMALSHTSLAHLTPYCDPVIAIVMTLILLVKPVREIIRNTSNMLLIAVPEEEMDYVRGIAEEVLDPLSCGITFLEVLQMGRKTWIEVYIDPDSDVVSLRHIKMAQNAIRSRLEGHYDQFYIELIPDVQYVEVRGQKSSSSS